MWYYGRDGKQSGPVAESELKRLIANGELGPADLVWKQGMANWVAIAVVPELSTARGGDAGEYSVSESPKAAASGASVASSGVLAAAAETPSSGAAASKAAPPPITAELMDKARQVATEASLDALAAFRILLSNPVGGFKDAYEKLGKFRAMQVGVVFAVVFYLCELLSGFVWFRAVTMAARARMPVAAPSIGETFGRLIELAAVGLLPIVCVVLLAMLCRKMFRGEGSIDTDIFVTGASLLPLGVGLLIVGLLGPGNDTVILLLQSVATCFTVLMLYSGCTNVLRIPEAPSTVAVAIMYLPCAWVVTFVLRSTT